MLRTIDACTAFLRRRSPGKEDNSARPVLDDEVDHLLREFLPASVSVTVGFSRAHCQASVEHEDALIRPGSKQTTLIWWCSP